MLLCWKIHTNTRTHNTDFNFTNKLWHDRGYRLPVKHSCAGPCCWLPWAWAVKKVYIFFPMHRPVSSYWLPMSLLHRPRPLEVRVCEHKTTSLCVLRGHNWSNIVLYLGLQCTVILACSCIYLNNPLVYSISSVGRIWGFGVLIYVIIYWNGLIIIYLNHICAIIYWNTYMIIFMFNIWLQIKNFTKQTIMH